MLFPNIYYFNQESDIKLDAIEGNALILIGTSKSIERILAVKDHQYYKLHATFEELQNSIQEEWQILVQFLKIEEIFKEGKLITEDDHVISFKSFMASQFGFPYRDSLAILNGRTLTIRSQGIGELHPLLKGNDNYQLEDYEALNFLRKFNESQDVFRYANVGHNYYSIVRSLLQAIEPSFKKLCLRVVKVGNRFMNSNPELTFQKMDILDDFERYCCLYFNKDQPRAELLENWVGAYQAQAKHKDQNPFVILMQQRRTGILSFFNPKLTDSIKLFKEFLHGEKPPPSLKAAIKGEEKNVSHTTSSGLS
jgi:hypothetical protein